MRDLFVDEGSDDKKLKSQIEKFLRLAFQLLRF